MAAGSAAEPAGVACGIAAAKPSEDAAGLTGAVAGAAAVVAAEPAGAASAVAAARRLHAAVLVRRGRSGRGRRNAVGAIQH